LGLLEKKPSKYVIVIYKNFTTASDGNGKDKSELKIMED